MIGALRTTAMTPREREGSDDVSKRDRWRCLAIAQAMLNERTALIALTFKNSSSNSVAKDTARSSELEGRILESDSDIGVLDALRNLKAAVSSVGITSCRGPGQ